MTNPLLTSPSVLVVTRTKDREVLLRRAVASVAQQTYANVHQVIVNDGGDPGAVERVLAERDSSELTRISVVHHEASRGMEAASNAGIASRDSDLIVIHDDDDSWHPRFLEHTVEVMVRERAAGVVARIERVIETIRPTGVTIESRDIFRPDLTSISFFEMLRENSFPPIGFLFARAAYNNVGPYDESLPVLGDWDFHLRFLRKYDIEYAGLTPLAYYHQRPTAVGVLGNSIAAGQSLHELYNVRIRNRYLRASIQQNDATGFFISSNQQHAKQFWELSGKLWSVEGALHRIEAQLAARPDEIGLTRRGIIFARTVFPRIGRRIARRGNPRQWFKTTL